MLNPGTLFIWLFFGLAIGVTGLLLWRSVRCGVREAQSRGSIFFVTGTALAVWAAATFYMFLLIFATVWGVAHMRPRPVGMFPEGGMIYAFLLAYTILGAALVVLIGSMPGKRAAA
jgi:hypothetical protein